MKLCWGQYVNQEHVFCVKRNRLVTYVIYSAAIGTDWFKLILLQWLI